MAVYDNLFVRKVGGRSRFAAKAIRGVADWASRPRFNCGCTCAQRYPTRSAESNRVACRRSGPGTRPGGPDVPRPGKHRHLAGRGVHQQRVGLVGAPYPPGARLHRVDRIQFDWPSGRLDRQTGRTEGPARADVERARSLTRLLLADFRGVVSQFRENDSIDLVPALRALAEGIVCPAIRIEIGPDVRIANPAVAEALLRIAQEAVTNAVKHSKAPTLSLSLATSNGEIVFSARDDGLGAARPPRGHGLQGIGERVAEHQGRMLIDTKPGGGFRLEIRIPQPSEGTG